MKKSCLLGAMGACVLTLLTATTNAATINFGVEAPTSGTINYAGGTAPLIGTNIDVDSIVGLSTPLQSDHNDGTKACSNCLLNFTTGGNTGGWDFSGGGTISLIGGFAAAGITDGSTLLTGTFTSATVFNIGGSTLNFKIAGAGFSDTKHLDLLSYFGMPAGNYVGGLNISFSTAGNVATGAAFNSQTLNSGSLTNTAVVPVPAAVWLFGSGLIGLMRIARRKVRV